MAEQATSEIRARGEAALAQVERQCEVEQDVVVIASIKRYSIECACGRDAAQHIERAVAIERRDLDGDDIVDQREAPPELGAEDDTTDCRLQIKSDQRNFAGDRLAMGNDLVFAGG